MKVLKLSAQGLPQSWLTLEQAVLYYAADAVRKVFSAASTWLEASRLKVRAVISVLSRKSADSEAQSRLRIER